MNIHAWILPAVFALCALSACGDPTSVPAEEAVLTATEDRVAPTEFAVRRCSGEVSGAPCILVQAGGKTLLFGAPEGAFQSLADARLNRLDAVFLSSLDAGELEGLGRVRNATWRGGRLSPLPVFGPEGTSALASGLDAAFARSDALAYLQERPLGDFDAAVLAPDEVLPGQARRVFDTGDLQVDGAAEASAPVTYTVYYAGAVLRVEACGGPPALPSEPIAALTLTCTQRSDPAAWPGPKAVIRLITEQIEP